MANIVHTLGHLAALWAACWIWYHVGLKKADCTPSARMGRLVFDQFSRVIKNRAIVGDGDLMITATRFLGGDADYDWRIDVVQVPKNAVRQ